MAAAPPPIAPSRRHHLSHLGLDAPHESGILIDAAWPQQVPDFSDQLLHRGIARRNPRQGFPELQRMVEVRGPVAARDREGEIGDCRHGPRQC